MTVGSKAVVPRLKAEEAEQVSRRTPSSKLELRGVRQLDAAARRVVEERRRGPTEQPRSVWRARLPLLALVISVHLVAPVGAVLGVTVLLQASQPWILVLGVVLLLVSLLSFPRLGSTLRPVARYRRPEAPRTFALVDRVGAAVGAPRVREVWLSSEVTSTVARTRWRRGPVIVLGAPSWAGLPAQARVALLGHEAAHLAVPELRLARASQLALATVEEWWLAAGGQRLAVHGDMRRAFMRTVTDAFFLPLRAAASGVYRLGGRLYAPVRASGELRADLAAARVAGRDAVLRVLDSTLSAVTIETALTRAAASRADLAGTVAEAMAGVTETAMAARRVSEAGVAARVDLSHPRTDLRRQLLEQESDAGVLVLLDPSEAAAVEQELRDGTTEALQEAANRLRYVPVVSDAADTRRYLSDDDLGFGP